MNSAVPMVRLNGYLTRRYGEQDDLKIKEQIKKMIPMKKEVPMIKYTCPKCGGKEYRLAEMRAHYSFISILSNFGYKVFTTVTCARCQYTEFYKVPLRKISNVFMYLQNK